MPATSVAQSSQPNTKRALSNSETEEDEPQAKRTRTPGGTEAESPVKDQGRRKTRQRPRRKKRKTAVTLGGPKPGASTAGPSTSARASSATTSRAETETKASVKEERAGTADDDLEVEESSSIAKEENTVEVVFKSPEAAPIQGKALETDAGEETPRPTAKDKGKGKELPVVMNAIKAEPTPPLRSPSPVVAHVPPPLTALPNDQDAGPSTRPVNIVTTTNVIVMKTPPLAETPPASESNKFLAQHQALLGSFTQSLTCQICLELMHKPYALAPCGHVSCYSCLVSWFRAPQGEARAGAPPPVRRRKTCPHCRAAVRERPAEAWVVKDMVSALVKSGLLPKADDEAPSTSTALVPAPAGALPAPDDPWAGIFPPIRAGGWGGGIDMWGDAELGIYDMEDAVYRCVECQHEIVDGECSACGRPYPGHLDDDGEYDDDELTELGLDGDPEELGYIMERLAPHWNHLGGEGPEPDTDEESLEDDEEDAGLPVPPGPWYAPAWPGYDEDDFDIAFDASSDDDGNMDDALLGAWRVDGARGRRGLQAHIEEVDEDDEDDDGSYEGSFIDDGEVNGRGGDVINLVSDEDEDERPIARRVGRGYRAPVLVPPVVVSSDDDEEDDDDGGDTEVEEVSPRPAGRRGSRPSQAILVSDEEADDAVEGSDEDEDEDEVIGATDEDEDVVEDDGSIRRIPMRFAGMGRRR